MKSFYIKRIELFFIFLLPFFPIWAQNGERASIQTVVIDAGHGGKDPGTHGQIVNEKSVVLSVALKLGKFIEEKYPDIHLIYTRKTDTFITLGDRAEIANQNNADLFISIHANASSSHSPYGVETYALRLGRTAAQQHVAQRENSPLLFEKGGAEKYKNFNSSPDAIIARKLQLSIYLKHSINLAAKIEAQFKANGRHDRGVKQAGFYVLYKTTMPSILIETGFLTNPKEEKFMATSAGQLKIANAIFKGFQEYYAEMEGVNAMVVDGKDYQSQLAEMQEQDAKKANNGKGNLQEGHVYYKVQVVTSSEPIPLNDKRFKGVSVNQYEQNNVYKYTAGLFRDDFKSAHEYKKEMRKLGFKGAFIVAFYNGKRIPLSKARDIKVGAEN